MQVQLDFNLPAGAVERIFPGGVTSPYHFRKMLAKLDTDLHLGLPSWFFGYPEDEEAGHGGDPVITIGISSKGLKIVGYGQQACALVSEKAGALQVALIHATGGLVRAHIREQEHAFDFRPFPMRYYMPRLVVGKTRPDTLWWSLAKQVDAGSPWHRVADRKLPWQILNGLREMTLTLLQCGDDVEGSAASLVGREFQNPETKKFVYQQLRDRLKIEVHNVAGHEVVRANGPAGTRLCLRHVEFSMNAELTGAWTIGHDRISGSGTILPSTREWGKAVAA